MEELIFNPNKEKLLQARLKRLDRWNKLSKIKYTNKQIEAREQAELEINNQMRIFKERAMKVNLCKILEV